MHRFYLPAAQCQGHSFMLEGSEAHHAAQVLRVRTGETVTILDGAGRSFLCEIQSVTRKAVSLSVKSKSEMDRPSYEITLLQAIPKGKIIESIIQKATELGVTRIVPILSERVTTHLDDSSATEKREKWQLTAIEAIKQCGQPWLPWVDLPVTPAAFLTKHDPFDLPLIASLQPGSQSPRNHLANFISEKNRRPESACIWIGPEGDFAPKETEMITAHGVKPITLGNLVLRCETAAIYCLSILNYELGRP